MPADTKFIFYDGSLDKGKERESAMTIRSVFSPCPPPEDSRVHVAMNTHSIAPAIFVGM